MNELGQTALEFFRTHPNLTAPMSDEDLVEHCRTLGAEMMTERETLRDRLFDRATEQARGPDGKSPSDGNIRAGMFRTATQEATTIVLNERVWSLLEDPEVSPRIDSGWDESLMDLEVPWHPDWREMFDPHGEMITKASDDEIAATGTVVEDSTTWWRLLPEGALYCLDGPTINEGLADGRLVWSGDEVMPRMRVERLAREAAEQNEA